MMTTSSFNPQRAYSERATLFEAWTSRSRCSMPAVRNAASTSRMSSVPMPDRRASRGNVEIGQRSEARRTTARECEPDRSAVVVLGDKTRSPTR